VTDRRPRDPTSMDLVRQALTASAMGEATTAACLDDDTIAAFAEGTLDAVARATAVSHLAICRRCRTAVASVARTLDDPAVSRQIARVDEGRTRRLWRIALPAAAAAAILVAVVPRWMEDRAHRGPPTPVAERPTPASPIGVVAAATALRWATVPGADRYRVTLFNARGRVLYTAQLSDTTAALPDSVVLGPGQLYLWQVEARIGWDRWSASALVRFSIAQGSPP
jgi:hypothetical protein